METDHVHGMALVSPQAYAARFQHRFARCRIALAKHDAATALPAQSNEDGPLQRALMAQEERVNGASEGASAESDARFLSHFMQAFAAARQSATDAQRPSGSILAV